MDRGGVRRAPHDQSQVAVLPDQGLLPLFSQQSSVILVGSVSAYIGHENATVYGAAKAGPLSYTRGPAYEPKGRGIRVIGLNPGPSRRPVHSQAVSTPPEPARTPLRR